MANIIPPEMLLNMYRTGFFPMAGLDGDIRIFSPDPRGILPLDTFHVPHGLRRALKDPGWEIRTDTAFEKVMLACAERDETWINETILESYKRLFDLGHAHSVEVWRDGELAGGLYGIALGAAFFGESMFHRVTDASKVALWHLVDRLTRGGYELLDIQWVTGHLSTFGAEAIAREDYLLRLGRAMKSGGVWIR